jgi:hypothetical protein
VLLSFLNLAIHFSLKLLEPVFTAILEVTQSCLTIMKNLIQMFIPQASFAEALIGVFMEIVNLTTLIELRLIAGLLSACTQFFLGKELIGINYLPSKWDDVAPQF